jgi:hypothetical protein
MDTLEKTIQRYHTEFIKVIAGSAFVLYLIYQNSDLISEDILLQLSFLERILLVFIFSFIIGKLGFKVGKMITNFLSWTLSQENKKESWRNILTTHIGNIRLGRKSAKFEPNLITNTKISIFIDKNIGIKTQLENLINEGIFWNSMIGLSLLGIVLNYQYFSILSFFFVVFLLSLFFSIYNRSCYNNHKEDCVMEIMNEIRETASQR